MSIHSIFDLLPDNLTYPARSIRTHQYLYIWNVKPDRWPAGNPSGSGDPEGFHDVDACPTKTYLLDNRKDKVIKPYFEMAFSLIGCIRLYMHGEGFGDSRGQGFG